MTNKYTDRNCSTPLAIKEIKIKTALRIHFTHVNMAVIKKITCWWGCREEIYTPLVGNQPLWESIQDSFFFFFFFKATKNKTTIWSCCTILGYIPKGIRSSVPQRYITHMLASALSTVAKTQTAYGAVNKGNMA